MVNRNINVSNVCIVGCAFCGFGQGKRSPDAYEHGRRSSPGACARPRVRRHRAVHPVGHPPRWTLEDYLGWLRLAKRTAARAGSESICTPTARWRSRACATSRRWRPTRCSRGSPTPVSDPRRARPPRCCTTGSVPHSVSAAIRTKGNALPVLSRVPEVLGVLLAVRGFHAESVDRHQASPGQPRTPLARISTQPVERQQIHETE